MLLVIPGYTGLFTILQEAFRNKDESQHQLRLPLRCMVF